jgi:Fe2+ transport system protein FeoA
MSRLSENKPKGTGAVSLALIEAGRQVHVIGVNAGQGLQGRLAAMGLVPGTPVEVIMNSSRGPFIVAVKGSRIILGHGMAQQIMVA